VSSLVSQLEMVARLGEETVAWLQGHFWVTQYEIEEGWLDPSILNNLCKGTSRPQLRHGLLQPRPKKEIKYDEDWGGACLR